jgi:glycosyltransferase involved in cell wall biosynthesis
LNNTPADPQAAAHTRRKILFLASEDRFFWLHPLPVARAALQSGYEVVVATSVDTYAQQILNEGFRLVPIKLTRKSYAPWNEFIAIYHLRKVYRAEKPNIVHHLSLKPVLYGSIARLGMKDIAAINAVTGLGYLALASSRKAKLLRFVVWKALRFLLNQARQIVVLENQDDKDRLVHEVGVLPGKMLVTRGAGVDVDAFPAAPEPTGQPVVVLPSRMLWIKGVKEFVDAAKTLRAKGVSARFVLAGDTDPSNPSCVPQAQLLAWQDTGAIEWWGHQDDMPSIYRRSSLVCLPSHGGEGIPKVLMEGAASGRALITTNVPGCRDIVRHRVNGIVVAPGDAAAVAAAIEELLCKPETRFDMARSSRELAVNEFSQTVVVDQTLDLCDGLLGV